MVHYLDMHRILHLYFLGARGSAKASTGMMSIYLNPSYAESVTLDYKFVLKDKNGMVYDELSSNGIIFCGSSKGSSNWGAGKRCWTVALIMREYLLWNAIL